jgi:hypothetical protein
LIDFIDSRPIRPPKASPKLKSEIKKKLPAYTSTVNQISDELGAFADGEPAHFNQRSPDSFMKHIDTSLESFFYQRDYSLKSYNFYF